MQNAGDGRRTGNRLQPGTAHQSQSVFHLGVEGQIRSVIGDIRDFAALQEAYNEVKPDIVLHLAAQPIVRDSYKDPRYTYETNVMGTVNLLECVRQAAAAGYGPRSVLNVTTDKVYHNNEWAWGYRENEPLDGFDPYSNSKSCSELVTHSYINSFFADGVVRISIDIRIGNVIGGRRLRQRPHHPGLCARHGKAGDHRGAQPLFHPAVPACAGTAGGLPDDRTETI